MFLVAREDLRGHVGRGARLEDYPSVGDVLDQCGIFHCTDAVAEAGDRERERLAHGSGAGVLARMDRAPEARAAGDLVRGGELRRGVARLVARQVEADDVRMALAGVRLGDVDRGLDAEVADGDEHNPRLDAGVAAGAVDAPRDAPLLLRRRPPRRLPGVGAPPPLDGARPLARAWG